MFSSRKLTLDAVTIIAGGLLWLAGLAVALLAGSPSGPAVCWSFVLAAALCLSYVVAGDALQCDVAVPAGAIKFFAAGLFFALLSLGTDCLAGLAGSAGLSLSRACTKSGINLLFTASLACCAVGVPLLAMIRMAIGAVWRR
ncbi:MAG TPA: hypothetical protein VGC21_25725 [Telluria sp.]|jgi:hypothetical protein